MKVQNRQFLVIQQVKSRQDKATIEQLNKDYNLNLEYREFEYLLQLGDDATALYLDGQYVEVAKMYLNGKTSLTLATTNPRALIWVEYHNENN